MAQKTSNSDYPARTKPNGQVVYDNGVIGEVIADITELYAAAVGPTSDIAVSTISVSGTTTLSDTVTLNGSNKKIKNGSNDFTIDFDWYSTLTMHNDDTGAGQYISLSSSSIQMYAGGGLSSIDMLANGALAFYASTRLSLNSGSNEIWLVGLPTHADEAAAVTAGLTTNTVYKTVTGELRIKL
jgi:hypothetical protein